MYWLLLTVAAIVARAFYSLGTKVLTNQIAFSSILLWGVVLSISFLGSHFSAKQAVGIGMLFVAIVLIFYRKGKRRLDAGVVWVLASAMLFSAMQIASAGLSKHLTTATFLLLAYGGPTIVVGLFSAKNLRREVPAIGRSLGKSAPALLLAAGTSFAYYVLMFLSYHAAPDPGVVVVLLTSQVVLSVLFGIVFMRERDNVPRKLFAGLLAFLAGALIKSG